MNGMISCAEARAIDLVDYLHNLGFNPQKIRGKEYWYLSPLRHENTASFKVDRERNIWYDHGLGKGGTLIDFGLNFHHCSLQTLLRILSEVKWQNFSFHPPHLPSPTVELRKETKLEIIRSEPLTSHSLLSYSLSRGISLKIAKKYLEQITYRIAENQFMALGFRNNSGGYELRSPSFKGSSSPKDSTLIKAGTTSDTLAVFEGMFSFLSFLALREKTPEILTKMAAGSDINFKQNNSEFLVLNSLSLFEKRRELMERFSSIHLFLDRDNAGLEATQKALHWSAKYTDKSSLYKRHKDLNDYLVHQGKQSQRHEPQKSPGWKKSL